MLGSLALIALGVFVEHFHLAHKLPPWMPMRVTILELSAAFSTYARDPRTLAITFGLSIVAHFCIFLSFYFSARAFGRIRRPEWYDRDSCRAARDPDDRVPSDQPVWSRSSRRIVPESALNSLRNARKAWP